MGSRPPFDMSTRELKERRRAQSSTTVDSYNADLEELRDRRDTRLTIVITVSVLTNAVFVAVDIGIRLYQLLS